MRLIASRLTAERGGRIVFRDVSLAADGGELVRVAGPNGSGKSTLLRLLAGLLRPAEGSIRVEGAGEEDHGQPFHYLGHLDGLKPALSVASNLRFWQRILGGPSEPDEAALDSVGLAHLIDLPAVYLSAGQRRRLAIARLIAAPRPIWLLDEPTTALDAASEERFGSILRTHLAGGGLVIAASHGPLPLPEALAVRLGEAP